MSDIPSMLQRVLNARTRIDRVRRARTASAQLEQLDKFHGRVQEPASRLSVAASRAMVLAPHDCTIEWPQPLGSKVAEEALRGSKLAQSEPSALLDPQRFKVGDLARMVNKLSEQINDAATDQWRAHCEDRLPAVPRALLDTLRNLPALAQKVADVDARVRDVNRLMSAVPKDAREWDKAEAAFAALEEALEQVTQGVGGDLPESVRLFLAAAAGAAGAKLSQLDGEVTVWLRKHGLEAEFCIRTRTGTRR